LEPGLPHFRFTFADVYAGGHNREGVVKADAFQFPFPDSTFDIVIASSVFTHMEADAIENYVTQISRTLKPGGRCFMSIFLFDQEAEAAVAQGTTIFDFRYALGACLNFDRERPHEGVACRKPWLLDVLKRNSLCLDVIEPGNWRQVRSYEIRQGYVVASSADQASDALLVRGGRSEHPLD